MLAVAINKAMRALTLNQTVLKSQNHDIKEAKKVSRVSDSVAAKVMQFK